MSFGFSDETGDLILTDPWGVSTSHPVVEREYSYAVTPTQQYLLNVAEECIKHVKSVGYYGSENQKIHYSSYERTGICETMEHGSYMDTSTPLTYTHPDGACKTIQNTWTKPLRRAAWTLAYHTGVCHDLSALAYCYLRDALLPDFDILFVQGTDFFSLPHVFCLILPTGGDLERDAIAVDPWPIQARSVLWQHHFCYEKPIEIKKSGIGIKSADKISRMNIVENRAFAISSILSEPKRDLSPCSCMGEDAAYDVRYAEAGIYRNYAYVTDSGNIAGAGAGYRN